jgi:hypothetical protein
MSQAVIITIAEPCHENWDNMTQQQQGKFCSACSKTVTDFTNKSNTEILEIMSTLGSNACGRFNSNMLNTPIFASPTYSVAPTLTQKVVKKWNYWKYFISLFLLLKTASAAAQIKGNYAVMGKIGPVKRPAQNDTINKTKPNTAAHKITIVSQTGEPINNANIVFKTGHGIINQMGNNSFFIAPSQANAKIIVTANGYQTATLNVAALQNQIVLKQIVPIEHKIMGDIAYTIGDTVMQVVEVPKKEVEAFKTTPGILKTNPLAQVEKITEIKKAAIDTIKDLEEDIVVSIPTNITLGAMAVVTAHTIDALPTKIDKQPEPINVTENESGFLVYPNNLSQGRSFNINYKSATTENIMFAIFTADGKYLFTQRFNAIKGKNVFSCTINNTLAAQVGIAKIMNAKGKWVASQQIIFN